MRRGRAAAALAVALLGLTLAPAGAGDVPPAAPGTFEPQDPYYPNLGNAGYDVEHYDISLAYSPPDQTLRGSVRIRARADRRLTQFNLDLTGMTVERVEVDGNEARSSRTEGELVVQPAAPIASGAEFTVRVRYSGDPDGGGIQGTGIDNGWIGTTNGAVTLNEPDGASRWFPGNDHPADKATFVFRVTVPAALTVVANGRLRSRHRVGTTTTWVWQATEPMATYLTELVIDELDLVNGPTIDGVKLRSAYSPSTRSVAEPAVDQTPEMLVFFTERFGPFPFDTYGVAVPLDGLRSIAFEAQTLSVVAPNLFFDDETAGRILAHELVHQWLGDWVSPASWREIWLNEGFATYFEWLWIEHSFGTSLATSVSDARRAVSRDEETAADDPGRDRMFGTAAYQRGALTIDALHRTLGDAAFDRFLRTYLERFGGSVATTAELIAVASEAAGTDLTTFFRSWLGPGSLPERPPLSP